MEPLLPERTHLSINPTISEQFFHDPPLCPSFKNQNPPAPNRRLWEHLKTYRKWLTWRRSCYQYIVEYVMVSAEKKRKFPEQCKQMVLDILLKLSERSPLWHAIVWCASCLSLANIVDSPKACIQRFMILADCLFALKKISASVANNWKYQFDQFLKVAEYEHKEEFLKFSLKKDCLGRFCAPFFVGSNTCNKVWVICKIVFYYHMVKASQKEDSSLTVKWLTIMYRRNTWHCKALCIM